MRRARLSSPIIVAAILLAAGGVACPAPRGRAAAAGSADPITAERLMATVSVLASPALGGRLPGTRGYDRAARFAAGRFRAIGLEPAGDDGYLEHLSVESNRIVRCDLSLGRAGRPLSRLRLGDDYVCRALTGSGAVEAPIVFCGYGLSFPALGYDDYDGIDVRGKVALVLKGAPEWKLGETGWQGADLPRAKARTAAAHGAVALLLVSSPNAKEVQRPIGSLLEGKGTQDESFPELHVGVEEVERIFEGTGQTLAAVQEAIDRSRRPRSLPLDAAARIEVEAEYRKAARTANVVGVLRGTTRGRAEEYVVVGAHLDHVGEQAGAILFPGANDNASGSAAVLAIAEAIIRAPRPLRSVVFVLFASEEHDLDGSRRYAASPPFPLERTVAMINVDCVGQGAGLQIGGGKDSPLLWGIARTIARETQVDTVEDTWGGGGADATPFHEAGVPTLYFAASKGYAHLHLTSDLPSTLDAHLLESITRVAFLTAEEIARGGYAREATPSARSVAKRRDAVERGDASAGKSSRPATTTDR